MTFPHPRQSGGTFLGLIIGLVLGLGIALAVAVYVTKAPVPFMDRGVSAGDNDAEQAKKNQNWNPNAAFNQNRATPPAASDAGNTPAPAAAAGSAAPAEATAPNTDNDPLGALIQQRDARADAQATAPGKLLAAPPAADIGQVQELVFFVQAGAFGQVADADNQRAKLALIGVDTRVSKDEVNGRTVYRVRAGPYRTRSAALKTRQQLTDQNVESVVVAVPK